MYVYANYRELVWGHKTEVGDDYTLQPGEIIYDPEVSLDAYMVTLARVYPGVGCVLVNMRTGNRWNDVPFLDKGEVPTVAKVKEIFHPFTLDDLLGDG